MYGIVAAVARENIFDVLIVGLKKLEYRRCDSSKLAESGGQAGGGGRRLRVAELERLTEGLHILHLSEHCGVLSPVLHVALIKGMDVDKPRNLTQSVTVE